MGVRSRELSGEHGEIPEAERRVLLLILNHLEGKRPDDVFRDELSAYAIGKEMTCDTYFLAWLAKDMLRKCGRNPNAPKYTGKGFPWDVADQNAIRECLGLPLHKRGALWKIVNSIRGMLKRIIQKP